MFIPIAQLRCAIELAAATPETAARPTPVEARPANAVDHAFEYVDALMGTPLSERDVVGLEPVAVGPDGAPLPVLDGSTAVEGNVVRRTVLMPRGDTYGVRVDGVGSLRYFGCAAQLPAQGEGPRRVRIALVPRARDIALRVEVHRAVEVHGELLIGADPDGIVVGADSKHVVGDARCALGRGGVGG